MRYPAIDVSRGLIIVFMALDHVRGLISRSHPSEHWGSTMPNYDGDGVAFFIRFITHLCAPGFFFLMGTSMVFMHHARSRQGIEPRQIQRHFFIRGGLLVLLQFSIINIAWMFGDNSSDIPRNTFGSGEAGYDPSQIFLYFGVLAALGSCMIITSFVMTYSSALLTSLAAILIVIPFYFFPADTDASTVYNMFVRVFYIPGQSGFLLVRYPILPWIALGLLGVVFGRALISQANAAYKNLLIISIIMIAAFLVFRIGFNVGDYHNIEVRDWIDLFNVTKYPPSPAFLLITLGLGGLILASIGLTRTTPVQPLTTFGSATLFFYVAHLYLYGSLSYILPNDSSVTLAIGAWLAGLIILYPCCIQYGKFKQSREKSHWVHYF
jgi:uncharacterized membrane protein